MTATVASLDAGCLLGNPQFDEPVASTSASDDATVPESTTTAGPGQTTPTTTGSPDEETTIGPSGSTTLDDATTIAATGTTAPLTGGTAAGGSTSTTGTTGPALPPTLCGAEFETWTVEDPIPVTVANSPLIEDSPYLSGDELTLFFTSDRDGDYNIYQSTRPDLDAPFSTPAPLDELNTLFNESTVAVSQDTLTVLFASNREPGTLGDLDLWFATRASADAPFSPPSNLGPPINTPAPESAPWLSDDALRLYFRQGGELVMTSRPAPAAPFSTPAPLDELNSAFIEHDPALTRNERVIAFTTTRDEVSFDLWTATREQLGAPFETPAPLPVVNTELHEFAPYFAELECALYSTRLG